MNSLPANYIETFNRIKERINQARYQSMVKVNSELILLYWDIGKTIAEKINSENWGNNVVETLSKDLQSEFIGVKGFSSRNLWYMKQFYETYPNEFLQRVVAEIPQGQNIEIFSKIADEAERLFYLKLTAERAWSRPTLAQNIKSNAYESYKNNQNNFGKTLPANRLHDLKWEFKDEYDFSFLQLDDDIKDT